MNTEKPELLQNNLFNNKEYIFINEGLYQLICKKNDEEKKNNFVNLYSSGTDLIICGKKDNKQINFYDLEDKKTGNSYLHSAIIDN